MSEPDCVFCKIVAGEIDTEVVYDEDRVSTEDIRGAVEEAGYTLVG